MAQFQEKLWSFRVAAYEAPQNEEIAEQLATLNPAEHAGCLAKHSNIGVFSVDVGALVYA